VRTENIVGLFSIEENVFDPNTPYIIERFVRSREKSPEEAVNLYTYIRDYASSIKCSRIELAHDTDVQVTAVYPKLGDLSRNFWAPERESYYLMKLGRKAG
jgi:galactose-1-phosphate uridylyltransferase